MQQKMEVDEVTRTKPSPKRRVVRFDFGFLMFFLRGIVVATSRMFFLKFSGVRGCKTIISTN